MRRTVRTAARQEHVVLGSLLREKREAAGLSQRDVARELDRTQAFVWKVEQGVQHMDLATLIDYAKLLGVAASELVREVEGHEKL
ncbi:MAG: helix-turn-helix domain-containing protein [Fimbriimonas sp.]